MVELFVNSLKTFGIMVFKSGVKRRDGFFGNIILKRDRDRVRGESSTRRFSTLRSHGLIIVRRDVNDPGF